MKPASKNEIANRNRKKQNRCFRKVAGERESVSTLAGKGCYFMYVHHSKKYNELYTSIFSTYSLIPTSFN